MSRLVFKEVTEVPKKQKKTSEPAVKRTTAEKMPKKSNRASITRAKAIRLQCIECMNYQIGLVNACTDEQCPLWPFRTGKGQQHTDKSLREGHRSR